MDISMAPAMAPTIAPAMDETMAPTVAPCLEPHWFLCLGRGPQFFITSMSSTFIFTVVYLFVTRNRGKKVGEDEEPVYEGYEGYEGYETYEYEVEDDYFNDDYNEDYNDDYNDDYNSDYNDSDDE